MNVLDIFYKNIVPEATTGRIDCLTFYNIVFSTKIVNDETEYKSCLENENLLVPTLYIKDKELFDSLLIEYVDLCMNFYDDSNFDLDILDYHSYDEEKRICKEKAILAYFSSEYFSSPCILSTQAIDISCINFSIILTHSISHMYVFTYISFHHLSLSPSHKPLPLPYHE